MWPLIEIIEEDKERNKMKSKEAAAQEPICILVTGPNASGKTAIVGLIAETLIHMGGFKDVKIAHPEDWPAVIREKMGALIGGKMDQVLDRPIEISEAQHLVKVSDAVYNFYPRIGSIVDYHVWTGNGDEQTFASSPDIGGGFRPGEVIVHSATSNHQGVGREFMRGTFGAHAPDPAITLYQHTAHAELTAAARAESGYKVDSKDVATNVFTSDMQLVDIQKKEE